MLQTPHDVSQSGLTDPADVSVLMLLTPMASLMGKSEKHCFSADKQCLSRDKHCVSSKTLFFACYVIFFAETVYHLIWGLGRKTVFIESQTLFLD